MIAVNKLHKILNLYDICNISVVSSSTCFVFFTTIEAQRANEQNDEKSADIILN